MVLDRAFDGVVMKGQAAEVAIDDTFLILQRANTQEQQIYHLLLLLDLLAQSVDIPRQMQLLLQKDESAFRIELLAFPLDSFAGLL